MEKDLVETFRDYCNFDEDQVYVLLAIARSKKIRNKGVIPNLLCIKF